MLRTGLSIFFSLLLFFCYSGIRRSRVFLRRFCFERKGKTLRRLHEGKGLFSVTAKLTTLEAIYEGWCIYRVNVADEGFTRSKKEHST